MSYRLLVFINRSIYDLFIPFLTLNPINSTKYEVCTLHDTDNNKFNNKADDELQVQNVLEHSYWYSGDTYVSVPKGGSKTIQIQFLAFALGSYKCQVTKKTDTQFLNFIFVLFYIVLCNFIHFKSYFGFQIQSYKRVR